MLINKKGVAIFHAGFMTYALIAVIVFVMISFVAPNITAHIVEALSNLFGAVKG